MFHFFAFITIISNGVSGEIKVFCDVKSNPAVFGNDVRISCRHNGICFENLTRTWITGPNKDLLFMDGYKSHFSERYEEHNISCSEFELVIANFSKSDLNNTYRCSFDFEECVLPLSMESANFEYHPHAYEIEKDITVSDDFVSLFVDMSPVYPIPKCTVFYGDTPLNVFTQENTTRLGYFYRTILRLVYKASVKSCPIVVNVTCLIGSTHIHLARSEYRNCSNVENDILVTLDLTQKTILRIFVGFCLVLVLLSIIRNWKLITATYRLERTFWERRRPILATLVTVGSTSCSILTFIKIDDVYQIPCISCVLTFFLTCSSLVLISNTKTISIREGFRTSCKSCFDRSETLVCVNSSDRREDAGAAKKEEKKKSGQESIPMIKCDV